MISCWNILFVILIKSQSEIDDAAPFETLIYDESERSSSRSEGPDYMLRHLKHALKLAWRCHADG